MYIIESIFTSKNNIKFTIMYEREIKEIKSARNQSWKGRKENDKAACYKKRGKNYNNKTKLIQLTKNCTVM